MIPDTPPEEKKCPDCGGKGYTLSDPDGKQLLCQTCDMDEEGVKIELMPDLASPMTNKSELAFGINQEIISCRINIETNFLHLAKLLKQMRDEKLYVALDHKTFESYIADPELAMSRSKVYKLIRAWELYVERLLIPEQTLIYIGSKRLEIISPMVPAMMLDDRHKADWIGKAAELSKSDLINEVRICQGKPLLSSPAVTPPNPGLTDLLKYKSYTEYVKDRLCAVCGADEVDVHHWPLTKGAGANKEHVIPLCRNCHAGFHLNPLKWLNDYKRQWGGYFYDIILKIWEKE